MSLYHIVCLICFHPGGTLRRVKPHKVYVCQGCVKDHGGLGYIEGQLPHFIEEFRSWQRAQAAVSIARGGLVDQQRVYAGIDHAKPGADRSVMLAGSAAVAAAFRQAGKTGLVVGEGMGMDAPWSEPPEDAR